MLISVLRAPTEPNLNALTWKMVAEMTEMKISAIRLICAYLMSCDAVFSTSPLSWLNECASQIWNQSKKFCFIYHVKDAFVMYIARKRFK